MKTTEGKSKTVKSLNVKEVLKEADNNPGETWQNEEEIREKAEEIYYQRLERGEDGTPEDDWLNALEYVRTS